MVTKSLNREVVPPAPANQQLLADSITNTPLLAQSTTQQTHTSSLRFERHSTDLETSGSEASGPKFPPDDFIGGRSPGIRNQHVENVHHVGKDLFFPVTGVDVSSLQSDLSLSLQQSIVSSSQIIVSSPSLVHGKKVVVNGKEIALFKYKSKFYAIDEKCPHLGGPLHLGDIEDGTLSESPCVICPWHKWCFELATGQQMRPPSQTKHVQSYPVRTNPISGQISIGFTAIDPNCFNSDINF